MSVKLHIYLPSIKYISLDVTPNARFFNQNIRHIYLLMAAIYFELFIAYTRCFFFILLYTITDFIVFQLLVVSYYVMIKEIMKFVTQAFNKDVEERNNKLT